MSTTPWSTPTVGLRVASIFCLCCSCSLPVAASSARVLEPVKQGKEGHTTDVMYRTVELAVARSIMNI